MFVYSLTVYSQVEKLRDGGIIVARGSFDAVRASMALLRLRDTAQLHVRIAASELLMVPMVALTSLNLVMVALVLIAVAVLMALL